MVTATNFGVSYELVRYGMFPEERAKAKKLMDQRYAQEESLRAVRKQENEKIQRNNLEIQAENAEAKKRYHTTQAVVASSTGLGTTGLLYLVMGIGGYRRRRR